MSSADPQGNATYAKTHPGAIAAPNQWSNGSIIGVKVDRIDNTVQFTLNGQGQEVIDISGLAGKTIYPFVNSWYKSGPVATINGGTNGFAEGLPSGYTALEAAERSAPPPADPPPSGTVTIGSGSDTLALKVSEDAWQGNAQFVVSVDGHQIGGTQTATASHAAGQTQIFNVKGTFAAGNHTATVSFLNDAYGGVRQDRNLYVTGATIDDSVISAATLKETRTGSQSFSFLAPGTGSGSGSANTVTVNRRGHCNPACGPLRAPNLILRSRSSSIGIHPAYRRPPIVGGCRRQVDSSGAFSAGVTVDHPGTLGAMFYRVGSGPTVAAWSGTPS